MFESPQQWTLKQALTVFMFLNYIALNFPSSLKRTNQFCPLINWCLRTKGRCLPRVSTVSRNHLTSVHLTPRQYYDLENHTLLEKKVLSLAVPIGEPFLIPGITLLGSIQQTVLHGTQKGSI